MTELPGSTVTRTFAAPPEAVFDAWVTPASFAAWWGGSEVEVPLASLSLDARPGGAWKATMILGKDNPDLLVHGEFSQAGGHLSAEEYQGTTVGWQMAFDALDTTLAP